MSPPVYCDAKKKEFLNLRQGSMSIAEYQQKFLKLSHYAGGIIDGERDKCRRFEEGLNGYIRKSVAILQLEDFSKLISAALTWERIDKEEASRRENRRASGACFNYGSMDHKVKDCPNPNPLSYTHTEGSVQKPITTHSQANSGARPRNMQAAGSGGDNQASGSRSTTRVYAMRQKNDQDDPNVVVDKFHLFGIYVVTYLILDLRTLILDFDVLVTSPLGHQAVVNRIYQDCPFMIQNLVFPAYLLEIPFQDYDVIVGIDWLHRHHALVDCRLKKMICQGCDTYLTPIVDTRLGSPSLKDIPIVCDSPAVFPDDLPGLPQEMDIEFPIKLVPRTTPLSIAPYRMAPVELKELKAQLQELLEKGFIRHTEGLKVDPSEIQAIVDWKTPKTPTEIRSFLGLAGYYRRFVKGFSIIASPLTKFLGKDAKFVWDDKCQESFEKLKSLLTQALILSLLAERKDYVV
uniref:Retrotransposon gag domain-containing protein n=1 Tax=Nicotiana tabacum TaxID=4097 RepID=A0A1S4BH16_TOBAC|nr:PREDICTED: uncharacterized protein LOC107808196 [Nicotiana tabacum]